MTKQNDEQEEFLARYKRQASWNTPLFSILGILLENLVCSIYWLRWQLSRPFQIRLLPKWTPRISIIGLQHLTYLTYGEILLALPVLFLVGAGYYFIFGPPNVELSGDISSYAVIAAFVTANKSCSIFSFVFGIPFERMLGYHKFCALMAVVIGSAHVWSAYDELHGHMNFFQFAMHNVNNILGTTIFVGSSMMLMTSFFPFLRRWNYQVWLFMHVGTAVMIALPWVCHSVNMVWLPLFWFLLDLFVRYVLMARCFYARSASIRKLRPNVIEVRFPKPTTFQYNPGQFLRIAVPEITSFQFHPFSISSAPHEEYVTLHLRAVGDWTNKLLQLTGDDGESREIDVMMEGPYGALSLDLTHPRYGMVLCVSGGIGVTHCRSVARSLVHDQVENGRHLEQLRFVWAVREPDLFEELPTFEIHGEKKDFFQKASTSMSEGFSIDGVSDDVPFVTPAVRAEVYLTKGGQNRGAKEVGCSSDDDDPFVVHEGRRPDLDLILRTMTLEAQNKGITHIAAFGCGPKPLIDALREACRQHSKDVMECGKGVTIDLHLEVFEF